MSTSSAEFIKACENGRTVDHLSISLLEFIQTIGVGDIKFRYVTLTDAYTGVGNLSRNRRVPINHSCPTLEKASLSISKQLRAKLFSLKNPIINAMYNLHQPYSTWHFSHIDDAELREFLTQSDIGWGVTLPFKLNSSRIMGINLAISKDLDVTHGEFLSVMRLKLPTLLNLRALVFTYILSKNLLPPVHPLSDRQLKILKYAAQGMTRQEMAPGLKVSADTIKKELETIARLLGAKKTVTAVAKAIKIGII